MQINNLNLGLIFNSLYLRELPGVGFTTDYSVYLEYFRKHLQSYSEFHKEGEPKSTKVYEGLSVEDYYSVYIPTEDAGLDISNDITAMLLNAPRRIIELQKELEKEGKKVCIGNALQLALFLKEKSRGRVFALFKPQIKDTLKEIKHRKLIEKVSFYDSQGKEITSSTSKLLLDVIFEALESKAFCEKDRHELDRIVHWDKLANNSIIQALFVHDISIFFNNFFPGRRKKNALVSSAEQELIRWLMHAVDLAPAVVSDSRYRQLLSLYKKINRNARIVELPLKRGKEIMQLDFLTYQQIKELDPNDWAEDRIINQEVIDNFTIEL